MYFLMQGTPFIYQGQEIGMTNTRFDSVEDFNCVGTRNEYALMKKQGIPEPQILNDLAMCTRDNSRSPMQWDASPNAGFSTALPWFKVNPNFAEINVARQESDPWSVLNFYRRMIALRKAEPAFVYGRYELLLEEDPQIYAYTRTLEGEQFVVISNISGQDALYSHLDFKLQHEQLLLANQEVLPHGDLMQLVLRPFEARVYRVS